MTLKELILIAIEKGPKGADMVDPTIRFATHHHVVATSHIQELEVLSVYYDAEGNLWIDLEHP
jgi:hypothetical protein